MDVRAARVLWQLLEPIHGLLYFAPQCRAAANAVGMRGYWMGYFAMRAAPLGAVGPAVVTATFYGFHPKRVARAIPDAWAIADPATVLAARLTGVDNALHELLGAPALDAPPLVEAAELAWSAAAAADTAGRTLAAANQVLPAAQAPHLRLWQALTTLREHRG